MNLPIILVSLNQIRGSVYMNYFFKCLNITMILPAVIISVGCGDSTSDGVHNYGPLFTSANSHSVAENLADTGYIAMASDLDADPLTYGISGGDDQLLFSINGSSGKLVFLVPPDFENPSDADQNNVYSVRLSVSDGDITNYLNLTLSVTDVPNEQSAVNATLSLAKTGQALCYDETGSVVSCTATGQDGEAQAGLSWPTSRFTNNADGTITDNLTDLIWLQDGNIMPTRDAGWDTDGTVDDGVVTWQHALDYVAKLNSESYLGATDWRLPNRNEIRSLANYGTVNNASELAVSGFNNYARSYWTSTTNIGLPENAWSFNMVSGYVFVNLKSDFIDSLLHVLPVRGDSINALSPVAKTGQTLCYDTAGTIMSCLNTGQDGALQLGVNLSSPRFSTSIDGSVVDNFTNLAWSADGKLVVTRDAGWDTDGASDDGAVTWQHALDYIGKLNSESYLGHTDWRLPNIVELQSLLQNGMSMNTWLGGGGFTNIGDLYWTSTSSEAYPGMAWVVQVDTGVTAQSYGGSTPNVDKGSPRFIWPVRSL